VAVLFLFNLASGKVTMRRWLAEWSIAGLFALAKGAVADSEDSQALLSCNYEDGSFTTFRSPAFPSHSIRIKEQNDEVCDAGSKQYTGWLEFHGRHIFFCEF
jgi:cathepsin A (carboxypeptidase C)